MKLTKDHLAVKRKIKAVGAGVVSNLGELLDNNDQIFLDPGGGCKKEEMQF